MGTVPFGDCPQDARMKGKEVRKLSGEEIEVEIKRLRQKHFELRTQAVTEKIEDTSQFGKVRGDVARLLNERHARRLKVGAEVTGKERA